MSEEQATIDLGISLYDLNKQAMIHQPPLSDKEINRHLGEVCDWLFFEQDKYFMLLCHEQRDYTIFHFVNRSKRTHEMCIELKEVLLNRGEILDVEYGERHYEIWIKIDEDAFLYYFFPYDSGVIEV